MEKIEAIEMQFQIKPLFEKQGLCFLQFTIKVLVTQKQITKTTDFDR